MALRPFCSSDEVRSALGVSDDELEDAVLLLPIYALGLRESLLKISATLPDLFLSVHGMDESTRTSTQNTLFSSVRLYSTYAVARQVGIALGMLGPKTLSDEKASFSRFAGEPYKDVLQRIDSELARYGALIKQALDELGTPQSGPSLPVFMAVSKPNYDPVTGQKAGR